MTRKVNINHIALLILDYAGEKNIQEMRIWLGKDDSRIGVKDYISLFRKFLR